ncbi:hypothetical protein FOZ61_010376, partial [Perkinsus olseni]
CSRVDYEAAKALLVRTCDGTPHPDMALKRFNAYQWDRKMEKVTDVLETVVKKVQAVAQVAPGHHSRGHRLVVKDSPAKIPTAVRVVFADSETMAILAARSRSPTRVVPSALASITADDREPDADQSRN